MKHLLGRRLIQLRMPRCACRPAVSPRNLSSKTSIQDLFILGDVARARRIPTISKFSTAVESLSDEWRQMVAKSSEQNLKSSHAAKELIDEWRHVVGSWSEEQLKTAQDTLPNLPPSLAFRLYHRIMKEMDFNGNISPSYYCTTKFYVPFLESWKKAIEAQQFRQDRSTNENERIPDPKEMFQMLQELSRIPGFQYEPITVSVVLGAVIATHQNPTQTPFLAQDIVVANALPQHRNDPYIVCQLMKTWAVSGRGFRQVSQNIERLLKTVPRPNLVLFNTAIHYYSLYSEMQRVEELVREMKQRGIQPDGATLNHLAHGYARSGHLRAAYDSLEQLVDLPSTTEDQMIASAAGVMDACRRRVRAAKSAQDVGADLKYADRVQALIRSRADGAARNRCFGMLIDIYGLAGDFDKAKRTFLEIENPDLAQYSTMIKACGKIKDLNKAKEWFARLLDSGLELDIDSFNAFINALGSTGEHGVVDLAHDVIFSIENEPRFQEIRPNLMTFNSLLKCIAESRDPDSGEQAVKVMEEIKDHDLQPDHITLSFCYKACVDASDYHRSDYIAKLIEKIRPTPNLKYFNSMLNQWASLGSPKSVQKIEELMQMLHNMAKTNPAVRPNVFSYGILIKAVTLANQPNSAAKITEIFEIMERNRVQPDRAILGRSLLYLCNQDDPLYVRKAANLLLQIEDIDHYLLCEVVISLIKVRAEQDVTLLLNNVLDRIAANKGKTSLSSKTFRRILSLLCRNGYLRNASDILKKIEMYDQKDLIGKLVDPDCYQIVIVAWQASGDPEKADFIENHSKAKLKQLGIGS